MPRSGRAAGVWAMTRREARVRMTERQDKVTSERRMVVCNILELQSVVKKLSFRSNCEVMVGETIDRSVRLLITDLKRL